MFGKKENQKANEKFEDVKSERNDNNTRVENEELEEVNEKDKVEQKVNGLKDIKSSNDKEDKDDADKKIKTLEEENKKLKESLMSSLAELDNTRRRAIEENQKTAKYAIGKFAEDLIPVMEDFYLAFNSIEGLDLCDDKVAKTFFDGIKLTQNELKKVFEKNGLVRLYPMNEDFNPDLHNAITQIESDQEDGKIVQVMQAGYMIKDRLLRPALVGVSKFNGNKAKDE